MPGTLNFFHYKNNLVDKDGFQAGHDDLDKYIKGLMSQNEDRNLSRHYVAIDNKGRFVSLLCVSASILKADDLIEPDDRYPQKSELPTIKIGRLVVDKRFRGQKIGEQTLLKAVGIFIEISKKVGVIGLTVDAKKEAVGFYQKYGFKNLNSKRNENYFPMILYTNVLKKNRPSLFENPV